jgi:hypothetical protein
MASAARSLLSLFTLICLMGASVATALGIYEANTDNDPDSKVPIQFIIPAAVGNTLLVMILVYLTSTIRTISPMTKFFVSFVLIGGLVAEIYLTTYLEKMPEAIGTYVIIVLNFLLRAFYVLQFVQDEWTRPFGVSVPTVKQFAQVVAPAAIAKPAAPPQDKTRLVDKWDSIWERIRDSSKGLDESSKNQAYREIIKPAREKGNLTVDIVEQAAKALKYKDGSSIDPSDIKLGGRRS